MRHELNAALKKALLSERLLPKRAGLSDHFLTSAKETALGVLVELMLGKVLGTLAMVGGGAIKREFAQHKQQKEAPWKVSYEALAHEILCNRKVVEEGG